METEIAGYRFRDARLLLAALTHTSYVSDHPDEPLVEDFERLEFLGDAVVDFAVAEDLYRRFPLAREGELTERRAQLVSRAALATVGERLGLVDHARLGRAVRDTEPRFGFATRLYETVVAAVYLDGGMQAARSFIRRSLGEYMERPLRRSAKTELQELTQRLFGVAPAYKQLEAAEPTSRPWYVYEVEIAGRAATGAGRSMREAQEEAAAKLLIELNK